LLLELPASCDDSFCAAHVISFVDVLLMIGDLVIDERRVEVLTSE
jgi:hypothetical protein